MPIVPCDAYIHADFEFINQQGGVYAHLTGWSDRYFSVSHRYYRCQLWPQREFFSDPGCNMRAAASADASRLSARPTSSKAGAFGNVRSPTFRCHARNGCCGTRCLEKGARRTEWLLGRIALEMQYASGRRSDMGCTSLPRSWKSSPIPFISRCRCAAPASISGMPEISISHTGAVVAVVSNRAAPIGMDLADDQVRSVDALKRAFSDRELQLLGRGTQSDEVTQIFALLVRQGGSVQGAWKRTLRRAAKLADRRLRGRLGLVTVCHER